jgi:hypothetical protein
MARTTIDTWNPDFLDSAPVFEALRAVAIPFAYKNNWPTLADLQRQFTLKNIAIRPVAQGGKPGCQEEKYESRIYLAGELQTRSENWHDLFNALIWLQFPKTKSVLNRLHYEASLARAEKTNRGPLENAIASFDESGAIIISRRADLLQMIRDHEWHKLFVENGPAFGSDIHCLIFGHALYEKALSPYVGMTAQSLLIGSDAMLHNDLQMLDAMVAAIWQQGGVTHTKDLESFPMLGVPGWHAQQNHAFYADSKYFRPKRERIES